MAPARDGGAPARPLPRGHAADDRAGRRADRLRPARHRAARRRARPAAERQRLQSRAAGQPAARDEARLARLSLSAAPFGRRRGQVTGAHHTLASAADARYKTPESGLRFRSGHVQWRTTCSGGTSSSRSSWGSRCWQEPAPPRGPRTRLRARPRRSRSASSTRAPGCSPPTAPSTSRACATGIQYATKGTSTVNGQKIDLTFVDDGGRPGQGRLGDEGPDRPGLQDHRRHDVRRASRSRWRRSPRRTRCSSSRARRRPTRSPGSTSTRSAPAARPTRTSLAASAFLAAAPARTSLVFAQDSAFGQGNFARRQAVIGGRGHNVLASSCRCRRATSRRSPSRSKQAKPDLLFVAWAGTTAPAMWQALDQQGVFRPVDNVVTGPRRAGDVPEFGPAAKITFLSHYVSDAPKNKVNDWLVKSMRKNSQVPDLFTPDGFVAGADDRARAAEGRRRRRQDDLRARGLEFLGPKGQQAIRPQDHAMLQPMFQVKLSQANGKSDARCSVKALLAEHTAPPVTTVPELDARIRRGIVTTQAPILATATSGSTSAARRIVADVSLEVARRASSSASSARTAPARRRCSTCSPGCCRPTAGPRRARRAGRHRATRRTGGTQAGLGRTFQVSSVFPLLPVRENVRLAAEARLGGTLRHLAARGGVREALERADWALERVGLARAGAGAAPARSSHGDKRQARARDGARRRPARDPARRADGRRLGRGRRTSSSS